MNLRANATFRAGDWARLEAKLVPLLTIGAQNGAAEVLVEAQAIVPVDTGDLLRSGSTSVEWTGKVVTGYVEFGQPYAAYVEFGTGRRGQGSAGAGPYAYDQNWAGMVAQPYLRPALDTARPAVLSAFQEALSGL